MYSSFRRIIKCVGFKPIRCAIYLNITSSFKLFNEFDYLFLSDVLLFESIKLFSFQKKKKKGT